jgi:predicted metallo-beta-lactamase superfamily hydrolase
MKAVNYLLAVIFLNLVFTNAIAIGMKGTSDIKEAIDQTIAVLEQASTAIDKGQNQRVIELLMEAKQLQKSISSANGQLSRIKSHATQKLVQARSHFNDGDTHGGGIAIKEALDGFKELKEKYHAMH